MQGVLRVAGLTWQWVAGVSLVAVQGTFDNGFMRIAWPECAFAFSPNVALEPIRREALENAIRVEIRRRYVALFKPAHFRVGRHLLVFGDGGTDHCRRCGEFLEYLRVDSGEPTQCKPLPRRQRQFPQYLPQAQAKMDNPSKA